MVEWKSTKNHKPLVIKGIFAGVGNETIAEGGYNLSVSTYVEQEDTREKVDIAELNERQDRIVAHESELRSQIDAIIKEL